MNDYYRLLDAVEKYYGSGSDEWREISLYGITSDRAEAILKQVPGVNIVKNANGKIRSYNFAPTENITPEVEQAVNSNAPEVIKSFEVPADTGLETVTSETGEAVKQMTFKSGMKQAGSFVFGEIAPRVAAVAAGITLGKTVDKLLYDVNPDFWDEHGMSTLNPDTWGEIIGTDTVGGRVLNTILGTTPDHKTQAYMDQNALAYMTYFLSSIGALSNETYFSSNTDEFELNSYKIKFLQSFNAEIMNDGVKYQGNTKDRYYYLSSHTDPVYICSNASSGNVSYNVYMFSKSPFVFKWVDGSSTTDYTSQNSGTVLGHECYTRAVTSDNRFNNYKVPDYSYSSHDKFLQIIDKGVTQYYKFPVGVPTYGEAVIFIASLYGNGQEITIGDIDGITNQPDATQFDPSTVTDIASALQALKDQYPEIFNHAVTQDVVQPDGSVETYTYVPVAMPDIDEYGNPITSTSTQSDPQVQPDTATKTLLDLITKIIQRDPPTNPPDRGDGDTPPVVPPSGSASSLYAIYNPTLSQINAFGAWLWSDDFVDQIKKLFNDPMQAIIGLHKVYAPPATGGSQTIKVGYLDSGVSAKVVSNQYTTIDCGTVRLSEQYHNVFDYSPYTEVNLYLPFIGIVNINVADVMRSSIHIVYHVDVLSGACLAEVKVTRDSAGGTIYQYAGNASVTLPISSGSYMGIVSAVAGVAGGIAGTIASGGSALPLLASSAGAMLNAHTRVEHSGGFSGNAGAMGGKIPYLIISRPQTEMADGFENYIGYPSNFTTTIGSCTGFIKVIECHVENTTATKSELEEIDSILKEGVII